MDTIRSTLLAVVMLLSVATSAQFNPWSSSYTAMATEFGARNVNSSPQMRVVSLSDVGRVQYRQVVDRESIGGSKLGMLSVAGLRRGDYFTTTLSTLSYTDIEVCSYMTLMRSEKNPRLRFALYYRWSDAPTAYQLSDGYWIESESDDRVIAPFLIKLNAVCSNQDNVELRWVLLDDPDADEAIFLIATTIYGAYCGLSVDPVASEDQIYVRDHTLIIYSSTVQQLLVRNMEGRIVRWLTISEGENRFTDFIPGIYLVGRYKVVL